MEKYIITIQTSYNTDYSRTIRVDDIFWLLDDKKDCKIYTEKSSHLVQLNGITYIEDKAEIEGQYETIIAKWYSQGEYKEFYIVNWNDKIRQHMSRLYTHKNDYEAIWKEVKEWGRERQDDDYCTLFTVNLVEFPTDDDIIQGYRDNIFIEDNIDIEYIVKQ